VEFKPRELQPTNTKRIPSSSTPMRGSAEQTNLTVEMGKTGEKWRNGLVVGIEGKEDRDHTSTSLASVGASKKKPSARERLESISYEQVFSGTEGTVT